MNNIFYIYAHYTKVTGELFYIGKGKEDRAYSSYGRNLYWERIVKKYGLICKIVVSELEEDESFRLERRYIEELKQIGLCRANIHVGGCGGDTYTNQTEERKLEIREKLRQSHREMSEDDKEKLREIRRLNALGEKNSQYGKIGTMTGRKFTNEHKSKISESLKNSEKSKKHLANNREKQKLKVKGTHLISGDVITFDSIAEANRFLGVTHVGSVCRGVRKSSGGYFWEYS